LTFATFKASQRTTATQEASRLVLGAEFPHAIELLLELVAPPCGSRSTCATSREYPGTGEYGKYFEEGVYNCVGCGTPLYQSTTKFNSGCGWPAFYEGLPGAITSTAD
ncbi:hypothetical protein EUGRSUZ_G01100, partial [Eucalyptus grandis]